MTRKHAKELLPILQAYADGKTIQTIMPNGEWRDCGKPDFNYNISFYRIKPEENYTIEQNCGENRVEGGVLSVSGSVSEKHYRPFKDCDELKRHYLYLYKEKVGLEPINSGLDVPYIWVKNKEYGNDNLITAYDSDIESIGGSCVSIQDVWVDMKELFDNFTFLDGSPVGKLEEEIE